MPIIINRVSYNHHHAREITDVYKFLTIKRNIQYQFTNQAKPPRVIQLSAHGWPQNVRDVQEQF